MIIDKFLKKKHNKFSKPYIIAELGVNHDCSLKIAKRMILEAKQGGANAVKFQAYKANKIASKNSPAYWDTKKESNKNQYDLFKKYEKFNEKDFKLLHNFCQKIKIDFLCTPFDLEYVDILQPLVPAFKISSSDITNKPLIEKICKYKKPIILSVGASSLKEILEAKKWIDKYKNQLIIMHCVLNYPTKNCNANIGAIKTLCDFFPRNIIGYSDHTTPDKEMNNLIIAWLMGAKIIEKHFTYNKKKVGNDHYHSMDKKDLIKFNKKIEETIKLIGTSKINYLPSERISRRNARRSIYTKSEILKGNIIYKEDLICKRPCRGIEPKFYENLIGKKIKKSLKEDVPLKWSYF
jgi:N-acetylneuraminate synthase